MSRFKSCPHCGNPLENINVEGKAFPWKDFPYVKISSEMFVLGCEPCGELMISGDDTELFDEILENSIKIECEKFIIKIKANLNIKQKELAKKIGITEVYMSGLAGKKKIPSYHIFNLLKILANEPKAMNQLGCFEGDCSTNLSVTIMKTLKKKFSHTSESDISALGRGTSFRGMSEILH